MKKENGRKPAMVSLSKKLSDTLWLSAPRMFVRNEMTKNVSSIKPTM